MILDEIVKVTRERLKERKARMPEEILGRAMALNPFYPLDVTRALKKEENRPLKIIAEVKRASPSRGDICENIDPIAIANEYEAGGAAAISVLTEPQWFKGDLEYISLIRRHCSLPLLRKDFIVDRYQLLEALVYGSSFALLIANILTLKELSTLLEQTRNLGMEALVEIHDKSDLSKAIACGASIIGINHRDLDTLKIDMSLSAKFVPLIPQGKIIVAESGLHSREELLELSAIGVDAFLIGESFMRESDRAAAVRLMAGA